VRTRSWTYPAHIPYRSLDRQHFIPRSSRRKPPEAPAQGPPMPAITEPESPALPAIPAYPRSAHKPHDRPVTPEVAGSSPVAPVNPLQIVIFSAPLQRPRPRLPFVPRTSRAGSSRPEPPEAANPRIWDDRPPSRSSFERGSKCSAFMADSSSEQAVAPASAADFSRWLDRCRTMGSSRGGCVGVRSAGRRRDRRTTSSRRCGRPRARAR
jgi:hypothetical protein